MTNEEFLALAARETSAIIELMKKKSSDYAGGSSDPFANWMMAEQQGLAKAEIGILIRISDKIQRVKSFVTQGSLKVKNETVEDALRDIIGYSLNLIGLIESRKLRPAPLTKEEEEEILKEELADQEKRLQEFLARNKKPENCEPLVMKENNTHPLSKIANRELEISMDPNRKSGAV